MSRERQILDAWHSNAVPWIRAVEDNRIESRVAVTNKAIVNAVLEECRLAGLSSVLDLGCGEGWLVRILNSRGLTASGIDGVETLVEQARRLDPGNESRYNTLSYEDLVEGKLAVVFDLVVANFSLLGDESVQQLFTVMTDLLNPGGFLVVQTLHPVVARGDFPYVDGWREETWESFGDEFDKPAPWFFRTLESWTRLFVENGFELIKITEPLHPDTGTPASVIFVAKNKTANL